MIAKEVSAINAEEIVVTFSDDVDEDSAKKVANYKVNTNDKENAVTNTIKVDGNKVTLQLTDALQNGDRTVVQTSNGILSKDGNKVEKFASEEMTFAESKAPALESVKKDEGTTLELTFDRPVDSETGLVKIDNESVADAGSLERVKDAAGDYRYTLDTQNEKFVKPGNHEIVIYDVKDTAAAYPSNASVLSATYSISDEEVAPVVEGIEALNANKFFIYTNQAVDLSDAKLAVQKGNHTFPKGVVGTDKNAVDYAVGKHPDNNKDGIYVVVTDGSEDDANPLYKKGENSVSLNVSLENYKDAEGNGLIGEKSEQTVTLEKNDSKPSVKSTELDTSANTLTVKFNENISNVNSADQVVVRDKDGVIIKPSGVATSGDTVTITLGSVEDSPYTVEFKEGQFQYKTDDNSVEDYLVNTVKNDKITTTVESEDESTYKYEVIDENAIGTPTVDSDSNNVIEINYGKEMSASASDVANYKLDGKDLPAGATVDFVENKEKVEIKLPKGTVPKTTSYNLSVSTDVTTAQGVHIVDSLQTKGEANKVVELQDNTAPELSSAVYALDADGDKTTDQIVLTFNEAVQNPDNDDFKVEVNGSEQELTGTATVSSGDDTKVILTLGDEVNVSQTATITITDSGSGVQTTDKANQPNTAKVGSSVKANTTKVGKETAGADE